jgi:hypothetical protein
MAMKAKAEDSGNLLDQARGALRQAHRLLLAPSPQALDECLPLLEEAGTRLDRMRQTDSEEALPVAKLEQLQRDVIRFGMLLENAAGFHAGWTRLRGCLTGGYTAQGDPARLEADRRVSVQG